MKNKKGFTLVELLVIIAVISIISTFALVNIDKKSKQFSEMSNKQLEEIIKGAAHSYIMSSDELINKVKSSENGYTIKLKTLIDKGYISNKNIKNIKTRKDINADNVNITIKYVIRNASYIYEYTIEGID